VLEKVVTEAGVEHSGGNASNHEPIYLKMKVGRISLHLDQEEQVTKTDCGNDSVDAKEIFKSCVDARETFKPCLPNTLNSLPKYVRLLP